MLPSDDQIKALLGPDVWRWALDQLPPGRSIDDVRFRDLISVQENDVLDHVRREGFDPGVVVECDDATSADDRICVVPQPDGRWCVYYTERGVRSDEAVVSSYADGQRDVVQRLMRSARIALNHRYRLAHPDEALPSPFEM